MKAAVIDLGTNTFHLIIADITAEGVSILYKTNVPVRLGEGRINDNLIIPAAFERGIEALKAFSKTIDKYGATIIRAIATSAVRSAVNGTDFVMAAAQRAGISIEVISGKEEAAFIFNGVKATGLVSSCSLIMDIGGGSTEFIICDASGQLWKRSYDLGAARLMQAFFHSDPISSAEKLAIRQLLEKELSALREACNTFQPSVLIGSAGAFETFAAMLLPGIALNDVSSARLDTGEFKQLAVQLINSSHAERVAMPNLIPLRVDMIVIAALLSIYVLESCSLHQIFLSTYDLKMGVLHTMRKEQQSAAPL